MTKKPLKVGFDLDGVILYNPVRTLRPITSFLSKLLFHKKTTSFYMPKSGFEKFIWFLLHKTSFAPARGLNDLKKLVKEGRIEAHLVTGRYASLTHDFEGWMKKIKADELFKSYTHNAGDQQPHVFKQSMINKLGLDVFVEDNWDIVEKLRPKTNGKQTKIVWITNLLDRHIPHNHKFLSFKNAVKQLEKFADASKQ